MVSTRKSGNLSSTAIAAVEETSRPSRSRKAKESEKTEPGECNTWTTYCGRIVIECAQVNTQLVSLYHAQWNRGLSV